jgi:phosphopantothenoylcysteine synthetase/decarboxylase
MVKLYEMKWWQKLWKKKVPKKRIDALSDLKAINEFLADFNTDVQKIKNLVLKLEELEKESQVMKKEELLKINFQAQIKILEELMERYEFYQDDVIINGFRIRNVSRELLRRAEEAGMKDLVKEKKKNSLWTLGW